MYQPGSEILQMGEKCDFMVFIVNGLAELQVVDPDGVVHILEELKQGDVVGQYSALFDMQLMFNMIAKSNVRVLTLDQKFFVQYGVYGESGDLNNI